MVEILAGDPKTLLLVVAPTFVRIFLTSKRFYASRYFIINTKCKIAYRFVTKELHARESELANTARVPLY